jgi:hypothetical protein
MTQTIPLGSDARERFLLEIAAVVPPHRLAEAHFFAPLRQGQMETGVCVIAALPEGAEPLPAGVADAPVSPEAGVEPESAVAGDHPVSENREQGAATAVEAVAEVSEVSEAPQAPIAEPAPEPAFREGAKISARHVVYSARYRWTRKGPERGKWECEVVAEADAPLLTVEAVVQGVKQRASEPLEVERLDGDAVRALLAQAQQAQPQWATRA